MERIGVEAASEKSKNRIEYEWARGKNLRAIG